MIAVSVVVGIGLLAGCVYLAFTQAGWEILPIFAGLGLLGTAVVLLAERECRRRPDEE